MSGYSVLSLLDDRPGRCNAELARRSFMSPQAMNELLRRLSDAGLVDREASPEHARVLLARLSGRGRRVLRACESATGAVEAEMLADLSPRRAEQLTDDLLKAVRRLEGVRSPSR